MAGARHPARSAAGGCTILAVSGLAGLRAVCSRCLVAFVIGQVVQQRIDGLNDIWDTPYSISHNCQVDVIVLMNQNISEAFKGAPVDVWLCIKHVLWDALDDLANDFKSSDHSKLCLAIRTETLFVKPSCKGQNIVQVFEASSR